MAYDPVIITLSLSQSFCDQLVVETEKAKVVQGAHTIIPSSLLQLASIVSSMVMNGGWTPASSDPAIAREMRAS